MFEQIIAACALLAFVGVIWLGLKRSDRDQRQFALDVIAAHRDAKASVEHVHAPTRRRATSLAWDEVTPLGPIDPSPRDRVQYQYDNGLLTPMQYGERMRAIAEMGK